MAIGGRVEFMQIVETGIDPIFYFAPWLARNWVIHRVSQCSNPHYDLAVRLLLCKAKR